MEQREIELTNMERDAWLHAFNSVRIPNVAFESALRAQQAFLAERDWYSVATAAGVKDPMGKCSVKLSPPEMRAVVIVADLVKSANEGSHALVGMLAVSVESLRRRLVAMLEPVKAD